MKILVLEKNGTQISNIANFHETDREDFCSRKDCFVCTTSSIPTRGNCYREGAAYRLDCLVCARSGTVTVYHGETGFSAYFRGLQHPMYINSNMQYNRKFKRQHYWIRQVRESTTILRCKMSGYVTQTAIGWWSRDWQGQNILDRNLRVITVPQV